MADIETINTAIKTELDKLKGTGQPLVEVYPYHTLENNGYPYASFELVSLEWEIRDTCNNERNLTFDLYVFQEIWSQGREVAVNILYKAMDDIISAFDKNYTLDGEVEMIQPIGWEVIPFNIGNWSAVVGTIQLTARYNKFIK